VSLVALELDPALVLPHDLGRDEQPEPGAASGLLRREEGLEDVLAIRRRDAEARVADSDFHFPLIWPGAGRHLDPSAGGRGVDRIHQEVENHLLELVPLAPHQGQRGLGAHVEVDLAAGQPGANQLGRVACKTVEVDRARLTG